MTDTTVIPAGRPVEDPRIKRIREYWDVHIHDLEVANHPVGSAEFFQELDSYRFGKLRYLAQLIESNTWAGQRILEVGCGIGIDLVRFARSGARVTGIDLSSVAIKLAAQNLAHHGLEGNLQVMNGESLLFEDNQFDLVYAHGVVQYTASPILLIKELHRVARPTGLVILMVYNRLSWLNWLSNLSRVELEHEDAPVFSKYSIGEFRELLEPFSAVRIATERFPVRTRLHTGLKAIIYNHIFVSLFNLIPRSLVRPFGWHIIASAEK